MIVSVSRYLHLYFYCPLTESVRTIGWLPHETLDAQDGLNLRILHMLKDTFALRDAQILFNNPLMARYLKWIHPS